MLLLDEPFSGMDEGSWRELAEHIAAGYANRLVVLVTHIRAEADQLGAAVLALPPAPLTVGWLSIYPDNFKKNFAVWA